MLGHGLLQVLCHFHRCHRVICACFQVIACDFAEDELDKDLACVLALVEEPDGALDSALDLEHQTRLSSLHVGEGPH